MWTISMMAVAASRLCGSTGWLLKNFTLKKATHI
jgi:hypothetical protein